MAKSDELQTDDTVHCTGSHQSCDYPRVKNALIASRCCFVDDGPPVESSTRRDVYTTNDDDSTEKKSDKGLTDPIKAIIQGEPDTALAILEDVKLGSDTVNPADVCTDEDGNTTLYYAILGGHLELVEWLLYHGANVNRPVLHSNTPYQKHNAQPLNAAFITYKVNYNENSDKKIQDSREIIISLIGAGADLSNITSRGTPLFILIELLDGSDWKFKLELMELMLARGAATTSCESEGLTLSPLALACCKSYFGSQHNQLKAVRLLLDYGADPGDLVHESTDKQMPLLHLVVMKRNWRVLKVLLESEKGQAIVNDTGVYVSREHDKGFCALAIALLDRKIDSKRCEVRKCVALLLQHGADLYLPSNGCSIYDLLLEDTKSPKIRALKRLVDGCPSGKDSRAYWTSAEVQAWVGASTREHDKQCPICFRWVDKDRLSGGFEFKRCSRCMKQYYCSRKCQVEDWPKHKIVCENKNGERLASSD